MAAALSANKSAILVILTPELGTARSAPATLKLSIMLQSAYDTANQGFARVRGNTNMLRM